MLADRVVLDMSSKQIIKEVGANVTLDDDIHNLVAGVSLSESDAIKLTEDLTIYITNRDSQIWDYAFGLGKSTKTMRPIL